MGFEIKHGLASHQAYGVWADMRIRCYSKNNKRYKDYGGRGISICEEWRDDPTLFLKWADKNGYRGTPPFVLDWDIEYDKALKEIRDMDTDDDYDLHVARRILDKMQMIAKKALEAK